ncbi:hypothetical protein ABPG74_015778 [Tetrahymena malaccensis]
MSNHQQKIIIDDKDKNDYKRIVVGEIGPSNLSEKECVTMIHTIHNRINHKDIKSSLTNPNEYHTLKYEKQNYQLNQRQEGVFDQALNNINDYPNQHYLGWDTSSTSIKSNKYYEWKAEEKVGQHYFYSAESNEQSNNRSKSECQQEDKQNIIQNQSSGTLYASQLLQDSDASLEENDDHQKGNNNSQKGNQNFELDNNNLEQNSNSPNQKYSNNYQETFEENEDNQNSDSDDSSDEQNEKSSDEDNSDSQDGDNSDSSDQDNNDSSDQDNSDSSDQDNNDSSDDD